ncbi:MerR family DNA-binding protein [Streptomyces sp. NPDC046237]|uniref:MerR family DNA-binding protein n=1 Tax=Streptomyces sp. NPDC046237 TaxID=3154914 RepID=UPI0033E29F3E
MHRGLATASTIGTTYSLTFIRRARALDLSLDDIAAILAVRRGGMRPCAAVRDVIGARIVEIDQTVDDLRALRAALVSAREEVRVSASDAERDPSERVCPVIERHGN